MAPVPFSPYEPRWFVPECTTCDAAEPGAPVLEIDGSDPDFAESLFACHGRFPGLSESGLDGPYEDAWAYYFAARRGVIELLGESWHDRALESHHANPQDSTALEELNAAVEQVIDDSLSHPDLLPVNLHPSGYAEDPCGVRVDTAAAQCDVGSRIKLCSRLLSAHIDLDVFLDSSAAEICALTVRNAFGDTTFQAVPPEHLPSTQCAPADLQELTFQVSRELFDRLATNLGDEIHEIDGWYAGLPTLDAERPEMIALHREKLRFAIARHYRFLDRWTAPLAPSEWNLVGLGAADDVQMIVYETVRRFRASIESARGIEDDLRRYACIDEPSESCVPGELAATEVIAAAIQRRAASEQLIFEAALFDFDGSSAASGLPLLAILGQVLGSVGEDLVAGSISQTIGCAFDDPGRCPFVPVVGTNGAIVSDERPMNARFWDFIRYLHDPVRIEALMAALPAGGGWKTSLDGWKTTLGSVQHLPAVQTAFTSVAAQPWEDVPGRPSAPFTHEQLMAFVASDGFPSALGDLRSAMLDAERRAQTFAAAGPTTSARSAYNLGDRHLLSPVLPNRFNHGMVQATMAGLSQAITNLASALSSFDTDLIQFMRDAVANRTFIGTRDALIADMQRHEAIRDAIHETWLSHLIALGETPDPADIARQIEDAGGFANSQELVTLQTIASGAAVHDTTAFDPANRSMPLVAFDVAALRTNVDKGEMVRLSVPASEWSPDCALHTLGGLGLSLHGQSDTLQPPASPIPVTSAGYMVRYDESTRTASYEDNYASTNITAGARADVCAESKTEVNYGVGSQTMTIRNCAYVDANFNDGERWGTQSEDSASVGTSFHTGLTSRYTPFGRAPIGSFVAAFVPTGGSTLEDVELTYLLSPGEQLLIAPEPGTFHFVVNDHTCASADPIASITVAATKMVSAQQFAASFSERMGEAVRVARDLSPGIQARGEILPAEMAAIQAAMMSTAGQLNPPVDQWPDVLRQLAARVVAVEVARLERIARIRALEREKRLAGYTIDRLYAELHAVEENERFLATLPTLALSRIRPGVLEEAHRTLARSLLQNVYPMLVHFHPDVLAAVRARGDVRSALEVLRDDHARLSASALATNLLTVAEAIHGEYAGKGPVRTCSSGGTGNSAECYNQRVVALSYRRPTLDPAFGGVPNVGGQLAAVTDDGLAYTGILSAGVQETIEVWESLESLGPTHQLVNLPIQIPPERLYDGSLTTGYLTCNAVYPVIRDIGIMLVAGETASTSGAWSESIPVDAGTFEGSASTIQPIARESGMATPFLADPPMPANLTVEGTIMAAQSDDAWGVIQTAYAPTGPMIGTNVLGLSPFARYDLLLSWQQVGANINGPLFSRGGVLPRDDPERINELVVVFNIEYREVSPSSVAGAGPRDYVSSCAGL